MEKKKFTEFSEIHSIEATCRTVSQQLDIDAERQCCIIKLRSLSNVSDLANAHLDADNCLCSLLKKLGYADVVAEYDEIAKCY